MYKLSIVFIIFTGLLFSQDGRQMQTGLSSDITFYYDALNFISDENDNSRVDVFVQVPYAMIQFVQTGEGYRAGYTITVSFFDEKRENLIVEKMWNERIETAEFKETVSRLNYNLSLRSYNLPPKNYVVRCEIEDTDTRQKFVKEDLFTVRNFNADYAVSDIMLISRITETEAGRRIVPNVSRNVSNQSGNLPLFFEIYSTSEDEVSIVYEITDKNQKIIYNKTSNQKVTAGKEQIFYSFEELEFGIGNYIVKVEVLSKDGNKLAEIQKQFVSRLIGIPSVIDDLDKAIDQMIYIASDSEIRFIKEGATGDEKLNRYLEYWKTKDPTPGTQENQVFIEYYRRITFANENFSHYSEGWRTDMGMVYIILGPPSNIERRPFEYNSKPYEIWEYFEINRRFVFIDHTGFGDYRLTTPFYGEWNRYRQ